MSTIQIQLPQTMTCLRYKNIALPGLENISSKPYSGPVSHTSVTRKHPFKMASPIQLPFNKAKSRLKLHIKYQNNQTEHIKIHKTNIASNILQNIYTMKYTNSNLAGLEHSTDGWNINNKGHRLTFLILFKHTLFVLLYKSLQVLGPHHTRRS